MKNARRGNDLDELNLALSRANKQKSAKLQALAAVNPGSLGMVSLKDPSQAAALWIQ
jgi:hypothetical protein